MSKDYVRDGGCHEFRQWSQVTRRQVLSVGTLAGLGLALPDLFREGKGVVAQGQLGADGVFRAREVLAKHDENYMPPEAAHAVEKAQKSIQRP